MNSLTLFVYPVVIVLQPPDDSSLCFIAICNLSLSQVDANTWRLYSIQRFDSCLYGRALRNFIPFHEIIDFVFYFHCSLQHLFVGVHCNLCGSQKVRIYWTISRYVCTKMPCIFVCVSVCLQYFYRYMLISDFIYFCHCRRHHYNRWRFDSNRLLVSAVVPFSLIPIAAWLAVVSWRVRRLNHFFVFDSHRSSMNGTQHNCSIISKYHGGKNWDSTARPLFSTNPRRHTTMAIAIFFVFYWCPLFCSRGGNETTRRHRSLLSMRATNTAHSIDTYVLTSEVCWIRACAAVLGCSENGPRTFV